MPWGLDSSDGWFTAIGIFLGGGGVALALVKMSGKIIEILLNRSINREIRKETSEVLLREEMRKENERLVKLRIEDEAKRITTDHANQVERLEQERNYMKLYHVSVQMETENKLLRSAHARMRAYLMFQQEELRKALGLEHSSVIGIPSWIDDTVPGPTASKPSIPISAPTDPGKEVLE